MTNDLTQTTGIAIALFVIALVTTPHAQAAALEDETEIEQAKNLKAIRTQIKNVKTDIKGAKDKAEKLQDELRDNEIATGKTLAKIKETKQAIADKQTQLKQLKTTKRKHQGNLQLEKQKIIEQIRAAYKTGRNDYLKLLLNQDDPSLVGRALAYYDYHNKARAKRIEQVKLTLHNIINIQTTIETETAELQTLKAKHETTLATFKQYRQDRNDIIAHLEQYIAKQGSELNTLQKDERQLALLFKGFGQAQTPASANKTLSFDTLQGRLNWPIKGKLLKRFGSNKKGHNLKWQGVLIDAAMGDQVNVISDGKVIFADWFRNLGLLIIIDHGDGYMSLYGHNQTLLKNTGDWVLAGETIANVGDSGGQSEVALYFEIRKNTQPLDPVAWCQG